MSYIMRALNFLKESLAKLFVDLFVHTALAVGLAMYIIISSSMLLATLLIYWLLGFTHLGDGLRLYIGASLGLCLIDIVYPVIKDKKFLIPIFEFPIKLYKYLELSHLLRWMLFVTITVADLSNSTLFLSLDDWILTKSAIYPAVVTSVLMDGFVRSIKNSLSKKSIKDENKADVEKSCSTCMYNVDNVCEGFSNAIFSGQVKVVIPIEDLKEIYPNGCENWTPPSKFLRKISSHKKKMDTGENASADT